MKKFMLLAAILIFSMAANAQSEPGTIAITPTVGLNLASTTGDGAKTMPGLVAGAVLMGRFSKESHLVDKIGTSVGLMYSMQGAKTDGNNTDLKLSYLNIPVLLHIYVWEGLVIKAGIQYGYLLSAKIGDTSIPIDRRL